MELRRRLANSFAAAHPAEAAAVLDGRPAAEAIEALSLLPDDVGAAVLRKMSPGSAARVLEASDPERVGGLVSRLPFDAAAPLLRRLGEEDRDRLLSGLPSGIAEDLRTAVEFPANTAGALMDPRALALSGDLTVEDALRAIQSDPEHALYNLYVVDREDTLTGVLNLLELLQAPPRHRLDAVAHPALHRLFVLADRPSIVSHEGWQKVYSLPVVNEQDKFVGALRYRTVRRLETDLSNPGPGVAGPTSAALGDLFRTGIVGMIEALSGGVGRVAPTAVENQDEGTRVEASHGNH